MGNSSGSGGGGPPRFDQNIGQLRGTFNEHVVSVQEVRRPI